MAPHRIHRIFRIIFLQLVLIFGSSKSAISQAFYFDNLHYENSQGWCPTSPDALFTGVQRVDVIVPDDYFNYYFSSQKKIISKENSFYDAVFTYLKRRNVEAKPVNASSYNSISRCDVPIIEITSTWSGNYLRNFDLIFNFCDAQKYQLEVNVGHTYNVASTEEFVVSIVRSMEQVLTFIAGRYNKQYTCSKSSKIAIYKGKPLSETGMREILVKKKRSSLDGIYVRAPSGGTVGILTEGAEGIMVNLSEDRVYGIFDQGQVIGKFYIGDDNATWWTSFFHPLSMWEIEAYGIEFNNSINLMAQFEEESIFTFVWIE